VTTLAAPRTTPNGAAGYLRYPLYLYRGDDLIPVSFVLWQDTARTEPVDLTGAAVAAQIRANPDAPVAVDLTCTVALPNVIHVSLSGALSATAPPGSWDLQVSYPSGQVTTVVAGPVFVTPDITRP
jgi:hypothetical protein